MNPSEDDHDKDEPPKPPRKRPRSEDETDDDEPRRPSARRPRYEDDDDDDDDDFVSRRRPRRRRNDDIGEDAGMRMLLPVGRSGWAIASGYLGLISVLCLPAPFALITGILAIREIKRDSKKHGMGRAVFGIIMGSLGLVGLILLVIVWATRGFK